MSGREPVWKYLARAYLDLQHLRMACEARIRKMGKDVPEDVKAIMDEYHQMLKREEKNFLKRLTGKLKEHPLWDWCDRVKGLGPVAALTFLGFTDPYTAIKEWDKKHPDQTDLPIKQKEQQGAIMTAGKAKAYFGAVPGLKLKSGERLRMNLEAKGRMWLVTRNVIMAKDDYYYPLYAEKKRYYMETAREVLLNEKWVTWPPFKEIIEDPSKCPHYEECLKRLSGKARRMGRQPKKFPCKLHVDQMAKRFLTGLLVSHATELMCTAEGLDVSNFKSHHGYIPPK